MIFKLKPNPLIILLTILLVNSCYSPIESDVNLVGNIPIMVNTSDSFTYSLYANNYSTEESYNLALSSGVEPFELVNTIVTTDFSAHHADTTSVIIFNEQDSVLYKYNITNNMVVVDIDTVEKSSCPAVILLRANNFSGLLEVVIAVGK
jgi:hypothetical protein